MVSILLTILKIIGIILLVLLGVILAVLMLVLFVPVRYRLDAYRNLQEEAPIVADIKATWLLHLISVLFSYPDAAYVNVKILGITIYRSDQEKEPKVKKAKKKDTKNGQTVTQTSEETSSKPDEKNNVREESTSTEKLQPESDDKAKPDQKDNEATEAKEATAALEENEEKPTLKRFFIALWDKVKNIKYTIDQIYGKIKDIVKNIKYYLKIIQSDPFKNAFGLCSGQLFDLLKSIRPRKVKGKLLIGTGDPASTGQVLSVYGMLYPFLGNNISVIPDFDQQIIEGELFMKGRITIFKAVKMAFIIFFNKDVRRVIKLLKREAA